MLNYYIKYKSEIKTDKKNVQEKRIVIFKIVFKKRFKQSLAEMDKLLWLFTFILSNTFQCHYKMQMGHGYVLLSLG